MCPFCLGSIGMMVVSSTSAGGLTALAVKLSHKKNSAKEIPNPKADSNESSNADEGNSEYVHDNG